MIQSAAPTLTADLAKVAGKAHGGSAKSTGEGSFSAILGDTDTAASDATDAPANATAEAAMLATAVAGGKTGKATGKNLPDAATATPRKSKTDADADAGSEEDAGDVDLASDMAMPAGLPFALAGLLQVAPAATKDGVASAADASASIATVSAIDTQKLLPSLPETAITNAATKGLTHSSASERALAVHQLLAQAAETTDTQVGAQIAANLQGAATPAPADATATITVPAQAAPVADPAVAAIKLAPVEILAEAAPATTAQLAARSPRAAAARPATQTAVSSQVASASAQPAASSPQQAAPVTASSAPQDGQSDRPRAAKTTDGEIGERARTPAAIAATTMTVPAIAVDAAPSQAASPAPAATQAAAPVQGPQDFATLVSRLNEAREAADPQFVRTAINHAEFGQISLEFRHKDNGLAVTMASSDPVFASTVQAAASASLASNTNGNSDETKQQQQQYQPATTQQQAASNGTGTGSGTSQNQQARADQAGQSTNRGQGSASHTQDQEASAPRQGRDGTRRSGGVYA